MILDTRDSKKTSQAGQRMKAGVHTGCQIKSLEIKTPKNKSLIEIWAETPEGSIQKQTIWIPQADKPKVYSGESTEEAVKREAEEMRDRAFEVLSALYNDDRQYFASTVEEFPAKFVNRVREAISTGNKVDVVVQYDEDGKHTEFPKWGWIDRHTGEDPNFDLSKLRMVRTSTGQSNGTSGGSNDPYS